MRQKFARRSILSYATLRASAGVVGTDCRAGQAFATHDVRCHAGRAASEVPPNQSPATGKSATVTLRFCHQRD